MAAIEGKGNAVHLTVRVQPKASRNAISIDAAGRVRIAVTAPPQDDAANKAVCRLVAAAVKLPRRQVSLASGARSRDKVIRLSGTTPGAVASCLGMGETGNG